MPKGRKARALALSLPALSNILNSALRVCGIKHHSKPRLVRALRFNIQCALEDCEKGERKALDLLEGYQRSELVTIGAWNKHRLGEVNDDTTTPAIQTSPSSSSDNIATDNILNFPLRATAELLGIKIEPAPAPKRSTARTQGKKAPSEPVQRQRKTAKSQDYYKLSLAPSLNLLFPSTHSACNITIAEIICFLPNWLQSPDIINRCISNNGSIAAIEGLIRQYRDSTSDGPPQANTVHQMMASQMRKRPGYENWSVEKHDVPPSHDARSISVRGCRTPREWAAKGGRPPASVQFKDLAEGVKAFPTGFDALDLTRCVEYHCQPLHHDEDWKFPDDFGRLVEVFGGKGAVTSQHYDGAVFSRWEYGQTGHKPHSGEKGGRDSVKPSVRERKDYMRPEEELSVEENSVESPNSSSGNETQALSRKRKWKYRPLSRESDVDTDDKPLRKKARVMAKPTVRLPSMQKKLPKVQKSRRTQNDIELEDSDIEIDAFKGLKFKKVDMVRKSSRPSEVSGSYYGPVEGLESDGW
ncbi:hypothetical protein CC80DRAFT_595133 [Byssothecium circinans]|uniref:Uncharacterized protein n=1 Tax=Byssothecium circinans TaxID=147558 RepID=A0A6A5TRL9_9PLEO|nr:hypothetical protein CC80DRAFT_595133 [Byssothecium circinans]